MTGSIGDPRGAGVRCTKVCGGPMGKFPENTESLGNWIGTEDVGQEEVCRGAGGRARLRA